MHSPPSEGLGCSLMRKYYSQFTKDEFAELTPMQSDFANVRSILQIRAVHREGNFIILLIY